MAFITYPPSQPRNGTRSTARVNNIFASASEQGVISVSRRRRVYEFLAATASKSQSPSTTHSNGLSVSSLPIEESDQPIHLQADVDIASVKEALIERVKQQEEAIRRDAIQKEKKWYEELASLRTPYNPNTVNESSSVTSAKTKPTTGKVYVSFQDESPAPTISPPVKDPIPVSSSDPTPSTTTIKNIDSVKELYSPNGTSSQTQVSEVKSSSKDSAPFELYSPPSKEEKSIVTEAVEYADKFKSAVGDAMDKVTSSVKKITESQEIKTSPVDEEKKSQPQITKTTESKAESITSPISSSKKSKTTTKSVEKTQTDEIEKKSIGEAIIGAIVDGVPSPAEETKKVDKSDLIQLVDSGKIKNLTVTKLRRLLSANKLKTSGRKAELIARLTSFAKAK